MKKTFTALLLLAAMLLSVTSCGNDDEPAETNATTTTPAATTTEAPDDPDPDPADTTAGNEEPEPPEVIEPDLYIPYGTAVIDGTIDDSWANAATVNLEAVKTGTPADDTEVKASVMWDSNGVYFLFNITDSDVFQGGTAGDFNNDSIYLYLAESDGMSAASFDGFFNGIYQFALITNELELMPRRGQAGELQNVQTEYAVTDTGIVMEFAYTPSVDPFTAGKQILLDFQYNDSGATAARKGGLGWYNTTDDNGNTDLWAIAKLLGEGESAPAAE